MNVLFAATDVNAILAGLFEPLWPEIILIFTACVVFLGGTVKANRNLWGFVALMGIAGAGLALLCPCQQAAGKSLAVYQTPLVFDSLAQFTRWIGLASGGLLILMSWNELSDRHAADHHACLLVLVAGIGLVGMANDLVTMFLALEAISIPTYILLYLPKHDRPAQEASVKYFLLSVFSSGLVLFGFSYLYGLAGSTNMAAILETLYHAAPTTLASIALIFVLGGLCFRMTAVPFHFYAPDVYQGTAVIGAGLLAVVPKIAGFVAALRLLGFVLPAEGMREPGTLLGSALGQDVPILFWILAAASMIVGNIMALLQDNLKRILAYSSIAHSGYMLIAVATAGLLRKQSEATGGIDGVESLFFYLIAYGATSIGIFTLLAHLNRPGRPVETVDDLAGLCKDHPLLALVLAIFLLSLIGIPLTAGFTGKLFIFLGAMSVEDKNAVLFRMLALIGVLSSAVGGWYYLRILATVYLRNPLRPIATERNVPALAAMGLCVALTVGLAVPPTWVMSRLNDAAKTREFAEKK
jgi:NADH-quinone oxidoreductase subunit N